MHFVTYVAFIGTHFKQCKRSITYFYRDTKGGLYTTRNDPRPQMIPKIALNTTQNDPRPQFFHTRPEMIPEEFEITRIEERNSLTRNLLKKSYNYLINCPKYINTSTLQTIRVKILSFTLF